MHQKEWHNRGKPERKRCWSYCQSRNFFALKLPRLFVTLMASEMKKRCNFSFLTELSRSYIVIALGLSMPNKVLSKYLMNQIGVAVNLCDCSGRPRKVTVVVYVVTE